MPSRSSRASLSGAICRNDERSIFRLWPKAAAVTFSNMDTSQAGVGVSRGTNSTSAESTFGLGVNAAAGSVRTMRGAVRHCEEIRDTTLRILDGIIEEHLERMGNGDGGEVEDLLDVLLKVQQDRELSIPIDKEVIKCVIIVSNLDLINPIHWF